MNNIYSVKLEPRLYVISKAIDPKLQSGALSESMLFTHYNHQLRAMVLQLATTIWSNEIDKVESTVSYPATWWDAVKERFFPQWALKRWPVKYTSKTCTMKRFIGFPDWYFSVPEHGQPVVKTYCTDWQ